MVYIKVDIKCDHYSCDEGTQASLCIDVKSNGKARFRVGFPDGWIKTSDHYDGGPDRHYCPVHGREVAPWNYR